MEEDEIIPYTFDLPMYMLPHQISGLRTGYYELNRLLSGWQRGEYVIVGYTNSKDANEFISNNASASNRVGNMVAIISTDKDTFYTIVDSKMTIALHNCDSIFDIRRRARRLVREYGVKALIIDDITMLYCQDLKFGSKENECYHISRSLCQLCRELDIPVISLVPVGTNDEGSRLAYRVRQGIGNLEQDADVIIVIQRDKNDKLIPWVEKNRSGPISEIHSQSEIGDKYEDVVPF